MQIRPISCQAFKGFDRGFDELNRKRKRDDRENHAIYETASIGEKCDKIIKQNEKIIEQNSKLNNTLLSQNFLTIKTGETLSRQVYDSSMATVSDGAYKSASRTFETLRSHYGTGISSKK